MSLKRNEPIDEILKSRNITFIIGPEKEQFTAHESSIASLSEPLRVLVTGGMKEAIEAKVIWEDVEPAVFVSLMEFAYTCNLSTPKSEDQGDHDGLEAPDVDEGSRSNERKDKRDVKDIFRFTYNLAHISGMGKTMEILAATIRYVYAHTMSEDQLRKLLLRFLITDMQWALSDNGMRKMLSDIPELASQMILLVPSYWDELQHKRPPKSTQADMTS